MRTLDHEGYFCPALVTAPDALVVNVQVIQYGPQVLSALDVGCVVESVKLGTNDVNGVVDTV
jgi:hypothetical protein